MKVVTLQYREGEKKDVVLSFISFPTNINSREAATRSQGNHLGLYNLVQWTKVAWWGSVDFIWGCLTPSLGKPCLSGSEDRPFPHVLLCILTFLHQQWSADMFKKGNMEGALVEKRWQGWEMLTSKIFCNLLKDVKHSLKIHSLSIYLIEFEMIEKWTLFLKNVFWVKSQK